MKKAFLMGIILVAISATGCVNKYGYTEQQTDSIAEYSAALLIKSDKDYQSNYTWLGSLDHDKTNQINSEESKSKATNQNTNTGKTSTVNMSTSISTGNTTTESTGKGIDNSSLKEVLELKNFDISYKKNKYYTSYPENDSNSYFNLSAREGKKLLVVTFSVKNLANKSNQMKLLGKDISYKLYAENGNEYKPLFTLLEEDLQYIDVTFSKGESKNVFLIFEVSEDTAKAKVELNISSGKKTEVLRLSK